MQASGPVSRPGADASRETIGRKVEGEASDGTTKPVGNVRLGELRILYLFAGKARSGSLVTELKVEAVKKNINIFFTEIDILRGGPRHDLLSRARRTRIIDKVKDGFYMAVVASPPCSTFSRARSSNSAGPKPVRSDIHQRGFPWLAKKPKSTVQDANVLVDFTVSVLQAQLQCKEERIVILEHPENLGR